MSERIDAIKADLAAGRQRLNDVLDQIGEQWETQVYADGLQWNVRQLVNHLADADRGQSNLVVNLAEGKDIIPPDFDLERYNRRVTEKTTEKALEQAREELSAQREQLLLWLEGLDEAKLDLTGRHGSLNILSIAQILGVMANHERNHADDIAQALHL
ncbi:MAG: DinB family protein [Chitinophagaceae bacterium]|nr:DinB family protein [Anaerolineae bacterium]